MTNQVPALGVQVREEPPRGFGDPESHCGILRLSLDTHLSFHELFDEENKGHDIAYRAVGYRHRSFVRATTLLEEREV